MLITRSLGLGSLTGRENPEQVQMELKYIGVGVARDYQGERPRQLEKDGHRTLSQERGVGAARTGS